MPTETVEPAAPVGVQFDHTTLPQRVLFASGAAADNAAQAVSDLGASRILLIADPSARELADAVAARVPVTQRIDEIVQHVPSENARAAVALARQERIDALLTIGGGSATGLGKIVARDTGLPIVAIPTTFAGSEATNVWGWTDQGRKITGVDDLVLPQVVVYDATLMQSLPEQLLVSSGMNAAAHAIDGFWAPRADPINRALGTEGLRGLSAGLRALHADPGSLVARELTLYGAYLAAVAFASAGSGMHHKICHALGGTFNLPHAETHAVVIGYVTAFNAPAAPDAADRIRQAIGGPEGMSAGGALAALRVELESPSALREVGFRLEDIPEAVEVILPSIPSSNPRPVHRKDLEQLLRAAWAGDDLE